MNSNTFSIKENGKEHNYQILKKLTGNKFKQNYVIYTDGDEIYASKYEIINNDVLLNNIETNEEWDYINSFIEIDEEK